MASTDVTDRAADQAYAGALIARSRVAQKAYERFSQERVDEVVSAVAWAVVRSDRAERLGKMEAEESGMGNAPDKAHKNVFRVLGTIAQMQGKRSVGVLDSDPITGITRIAKPKGVFCALTPSTNMAAGTTQNVLAVLKGRNSVVVSPQPRTTQTALETVALIREQLVKVNAPADLVLCVDDPTRGRRDALMEQVDVVLATGGAQLVKAAYRSGKPAIGVGPGNAVTVFDGTADLEEAVDRIVRGKTFDYGTSCSTENAVVVADAWYERMLVAFARRGGRLLDAREKAQLQATMWKDGKLDDRLICRSPARIAELAGLAIQPDTRFFLVEEDGAGPAHPFSGEKLSVVLAVYRYREFGDAIARVRSIVDYQGRGHSCGIHSTDDANILALAEAVDVCRVLVNQVQSAGNSGNFDNGLPFTSTLGCGSWGGNSVDGNVTWEHCINITKLSRPIPARVPSLGDVFGGLWAKYGE